MLRPCDTICAGRFTVDHIDIERPEETEAQATRRPRLLEWIWHPWYAKLWWAAIAAFWAGAWIFPALGIQRLPVSDTALIYVAIILHPQTALPVLGFGYVRALFTLPTDDSDAADDLDDAGGDGFGRHRFMSYLSDPSDPRSPLNPANPASPHNFNRPGH